MGGQKVVGRREHMVSWPQSEAVVGQAETHRRAVGQRDLVGGDPQIPRRGSADGIVVGAFFTYHSCRVGVELVAPARYRGTNRRRVSRQHEGCEVCELGVQRELGADVVPVGQVCRGLHRYCSGRLVRARPRTPGQGQSSGECTAGEKGPPVEGRRRHGNDRTCGVRATEIVRRPAEGGRNSTSVGLGDVGIGSRGTLSCGSGTEVFDNRCERL
jgi:hypothetical protein